MLNSTKYELIAINDEALEHIINTKCLHKIRHNGEIDTSLLITIGEIPLIIKRVIIDNQSSPIARKIHYFYDITHETNVSEMKAELLFTIAHELRNSLSSIHGYTELLLKRANDSQSQQFLEIVLKQTNKLNRMINDILDLSQSESEKIVLLSTNTVEVNAFVKEVVEDYFVKRKPIISLNQEAIFIEAVKEKLSQAMINIFSNAIKYSDENSLISIEITLDIDSNMVGIKVADEGIGMTHAEQSKLFTRFYRANPEGSITGTGLGLSFVKEILELHCGGIEVHSQKGEGTQVTLWIPTIDYLKDTRPQLLLSA